MINRVLYLLPFILISTFSCSQSIFSLNEEDSKNDKILDNSKTIKPNGPVISFNVTNYEAGIVQQDSNLSYNYWLTNIGDEPLLISNVRTSCNCTVASFPKTPILPNRRDTVVLSLDTKHLGSYKKVAAVYSNAKNNYDNSINKSRVILNISWTVVDKADKEK